MTGSHLERGRDRYDARDWGACCTELAAADHEHPLTPDDLVLLSIASYLAGHDQASVDALARAHRAHLQSASWRLAARCAIWLAFLLSTGGDDARASGWAERARGLVDEHQLGGAEAGFLSALRAHQLEMRGESVEALALAGQAAATGRAANDPDLWTLAQLTTAAALIDLGRAAEALPVLDEVMLAATNDELLPTVTGIAYCVVISTCLRLFDLRRAREWTTALSSWCAEQPDLRPYRGFCLVHRAQIKAMEGSWDEALTEATTACERLPLPAAGLAWYELGEIHRLRGAFDEAEEAYRRANSLGHQPEPGLARLRLTQGRIDAAVTTLRRLHAEPGRPDRPTILVAYVDAMVACGDVDAASRASAELTELSHRLDMPLLRARADETAGAVLLADARAADALEPLRRAAREWQELDMPYDGARTRTRIGDCLRHLGDEESSRLEYDAAREVFEHLGAQPAVAALGVTSRSSQGPLSAREIEVIRLVAAGNSNRGIAEALVLSEKTVARHLSNIYAKLDLTSRAAATAYAYDHGLV